MWMDGLISFWGAMLGGFVGGLSCMLMCVRDIESRHEETCHCINKLRKRVKRAAVPKKEG